MEERDWVVAGAYRDDSPIGEIIETLVYGPFTNNEAHARWDQLKAEPWYAETKWEIVGVIRCQK